MRALPGEPEIAVVEARGGDRSRRRTGTTCRMNLGSVSAAAQGVLASATASAVTGLCTHRIRLAPTSAQAAAFRYHAGFTRLGYNGAVSAFSSGLGRWRLARRQTLRPQFNAIKDERGVVSANARQGALIDAGRALARWDAYRQAVKAGPPRRTVGCPRDKKRGLRPAFRADDGPATLRTDGKRLPLPAQMGGAVRRREALRGHGRITRVRIRQRAGHRYARMAADDGRPASPVAAQGQPVLGVDRELKNQAVCRDGVVYARPTPLDKRSLPQSVQTPLDPWLAAANDLSVPRTAWTIPATRPAAQSPASRRSCKIRRDGCGAMQSFPWAFWTTKGSVSAPWGNA